jgi:hypothetical protein
MALSWTNYSKLRNSSRFWINTMMIYSPKIFTLLYGFTQSFKIRSVLKHTKCLTYPWSSRHWERDEQRIWYHFVEDTKWKQMTEIKSLERKRVNSWIDLFPKNDMKCRIRVTLITWIKNQSSCMSSRSDFHRKRFQMILKSRLDERQSAINPWRATFGKLDMPQAIFFHFLLSWNPN